MLAPQPGEWGIDRVRVEVFGRWRTHLANGHEFFARRLSDTTGPRWLSNPVFRNSGISVESRKSPTLTMGNLKIDATGCTSSSGHIAVKLDVNPTRTLSSLLVRHGRRHDFSGYLSSCTVFDFFEVLGEGYRLPPSLDGGDNYLPDYPSARSVLGADPFAAFMPIYLMQLRRLVGRVLCEYPGEISEDGSEQVFCSADGEVRLDWHAANIPQLETYFERFHSRARAAVRTAGSALIDGDIDNILRLHADTTSLPAIGRAGDQFAVSASITMGIHQRHELAVYAKTEQRIRFEVRRLRRGRYTRLDASDEVVDTPMTMDGRLLHIMLSNGREEALRLVRWQDVFESFDEPDEPGIGDLSSLIANVAAASDGSALVSHLLLEKLLLDGGVSKGADTRIPEGAIARLVRSGVLQRSRVRSRHPASTPVRFQLTRDYRALRIRIVSALRPAQPMS